MTSDDLTKSQGKVISEALFPGFNYLARLRKRMQKAGFSSNDKFFQLVEKAHEVMQHLVAEARYLWCDGVGRSDRPE